MSEMSDKPELTADEIAQLLREAMGYDKRGQAYKSPAPAVPGEVFKCINGHKWSSREDATKCCTGVWRPVIHPKTGEQFLIADYDSIRPLGDEFEGYARRLNRHPLADELFKKPAP